MEPVGTDVTTNIEPVENGDEKWNIRATFLYFAGSYLLLQTQYILSFLIPGMLSEESSLGDCASILSLLRRFLVAAASGLV